MTYWPYFLWYEKRAGLDLDAKAYLDAISCPDASVRSAWSSFVVAMKASGVWDISDRILPFPYWSGMTEANVWPVCARTLTTCSYTGTLMNNGTNYYYTDSGNYIDLLYTPSSSLMTANDYLTAFRWTFGLFPFDEDYVLLGCSNSTSRVIVFNFGNSKISGYYFGPQGKLSAINAHYDQFGADFRIGQRTSATSLEHYSGTNLIAQNTTNDTGTLPSQSMYLGCFNNNGTPFSYFHEGGIGYLHLGKSWNSAQRTQMTASELAWAGVNGR